jgi:hypothetical protein
VTDRTVMDHVPDEDFVLDYYDELDAADRERVRGHLARCGECRRADQDVRSTLRMVDVAPPPEPPETFEREMWARIAPHLGVRQPSPSWKARLIHAWQVDRASRMRIVWAGGVAAALVIAFFVGRAGRPAPATSETAPVVSAAAVRERVLDAEVEQHLERTRRVLSELVDTDGSGAVMLATDRAQAADLVAAGRVYRRSADALGEAATSELLEDLERVLLDVANSSPEDAPEELSDVRARIERQDLVFRLRVVGAELRRRQRSETPVF